MEALFEKELPVLLRVGEREDRYTDVCILTATLKTFMYRRNVTVRCNVTLNTPSTPVTKKV